MKHTSTMMKTRHSTTTDSWHHSPGLISGFSEVKKKSQNKNFDDHITTI